MSTPCLSTLVAEDNIPLSDEAKEATIAALENSFRRELFPTAREMAHLEGMVRGTFRDRVAVAPAAAEAAAVEVCPRVRAALRGAICGLHPSTVMAVVSRGGTYNSNAAGAAPEPIPVPLLCMCIANAGNAPYERTLPEASVFARDALAGLVDLPTTVTATHIERPVVRGPVESARAGVVAITGDINDVAVLLANEPVPEELTGVCGTRMGRERCEAGRHTSQHRHRDVAHCYYLRPPVCCTQWIVEALLRGVPSAACMMR